MLKKSLGVGCAWANRPGIYTNVEHYVPWIKSIIEDGICHQRTETQNIKSGDYIPQTDIDNSSNNNKNNDDSNISIGFDENNNNNQNVDNENNKNNKNNKSNNNNNIGNDIPKSSFESKTRTRLAPEPPELQPGNSKRFTEDKFSLEN